MDFAQMTDRAAAVRARYAAWERARHGRSRTTQEIALGLVGDVGDLMKPVQGKAGVRPRVDLDEALAHELADCLRAVMTLAAEYDVDLETAFVETMNGIEATLSQSGPAGSPDASASAVLLTEPGEPARRAVSVSLRGLLARVPDRGVTVHADRDRVLVVNPGGYVGDSTSREIAYAQATGKPISFTDPV
ncbi:hypothetical protein [Cellulomonas hominis]